MARVWDSFPGGGSELLALLALADWADEYGWCWPSIAAIGKKVRLSRSQAQRVIHRLINQGIVSVTGNETGGAPGSTRQYRINIDKLTYCKVPANTGRRNATGRVDATGCMGVTEESQRCTETRRTGAAQTISEPSVPASIVADDRRKAVDRCPYQQIVDSFHQHFPSGPRVTVLNDKCKKAIAARWREVSRGEYRAPEMPREPRDDAKALRFFGRYFEYCEALDWCTGRRPMRNGQVFRGTIDNLMRADFMAKRADEVYDGRGPG